MAIIYLMESAFYVLQNVLYAVPINHVHHVFLVIIFKIINAVLPNVHLAMKFHNVIIVYQDTI